jgi:hepatocyte growth factor-regulated tyrosine kinase substrate
MDNLVSLMNAPGAVNQDVKAKMLELIQAWSIAFEGNSQLSYVKDVYEHLKADGCQFPAKPKLTSTFVDSSAVSLPLVEDRIRN